MKQYFYTVELNEEIGSKFEELAELTAHDDREEFAATLLARAIDQFEQEFKIWMYRALTFDLLDMNDPCVIEDESEDKKYPNDLNDEIPF